MIEDAFSPEHIAALRDEIDTLEAELNPAGQEQAVLHERAAAARGATGPLEPPPDLRTRSGALISNISEAEAITFTSALVTKSALAREFCGCEVFQRIVHDILNVPDVRLFHDQAVYKKPCPGRTFPFHQVRSMLFGVPSS